METEEKPEVSIKNQMLGLVLLLVVFGVIYLIMKGMPKMNEWIDTKRKAFVEGVEVPAVKSSSEPEPGIPPAEVEVEEKKARPDPEYGAQIVEQLAGMGEVEVSHLAISEDETEMVAALRVEKEGSEARLFEVFFERDKFGRYISTPDSPVDVELKLWQE